MSRRERSLRALSMALGTIVVVLSLVRATPASAQPRRRRAHTPVASTAIPASIGAATALAAGIGLYVAPDPSPGGNASTWRGGILLDEGMRDGFRIGTHSGREAAATASDILMVATMLNAVAIDALTIPLVQEDPHLAWQAGSAYSLALGITLALNDVVKEAVGRARPFERECADNPQSPSCTSQDTFASFYSGHTAVAFTSAGFSCAMHLSRSLYDDPVADAMSCGASLALAATTGLLRIASDRHYLSDVLVGALIGFVVGYVIPLIFVPSRQEAAQEVSPEDLAAEAEDHIAPPLPGPSVMAAPTFSPGPDGLGSSSFGISVSGTF